MSILAAEPFGIYTDPRYSRRTRTATRCRPCRSPSSCEVVRDLAADGDEVSELRFFPLDRLPSPIYPIHLDSIADYRERPGRFIVK